MSVKVIFIPSVFENEAIVSELEPGKLVPLLKKFYSLHKEKYPNLVREKVVIEVNDNVSEGSRILDVSDWNEYEAKDGTEIQIIPSIGGGKSGGIISTVIGMVLVGAGLLYPPAAFLVPIGVSLMIGGALSLGAPWPSYGYASPAGDLSSSSPTFSWEVQGNQTDPSLPVPVIYGELRIAPHLINVFLDQDVNMFWNKDWKTQIPGNKTTIGYVNKFTVSQCYGVKFVLLNFNIYPQTYKIEYSLDELSWSTWSTITIVGKYSDEGGYLPVPELVIADFKQVSDWVIHDYYIRITDISQFLSGVQYWRDPRFQTVGAGYDHIDNVDVMKDSTTVHHEQDTQFLNLLYGVCEGPIDGISQVEINGTPIGSFADQPHVQIRLGGTDENLITGFNTIRNFTPYGSGGQRMLQNTPLTLTTAGDEVGAFDIYFKLPSLFKWNLSTGVLEENSVEIKVEYSIHGANSWTSQNLVITSTSRSSITRLLRFPGDAFLTANQYDIRVTRLSQESTDTNINSEIDFLGIYEIQNKDLIYPKTALLAIRIQATSQLSGSLPKVTCLVRGLKVYNLKTQVTEFTKNPVYCFYDFLVNTRYGLGNFIDSSAINTTQLITEADYCDALVTVPASDIKPSYAEPRFQLDLVIDGITNAFDLISKFGATMRGLPIYSEGTIQLKIDKANDVPVQVISMGNIIKDSLIVNYIDSTQVPNVIEVQFLDKENNYEMNSLQIRSSDVEAATVKERIGRIALMGIVRKSQAIRIGTYFYNTGKYITKAIQFKTMMDSLHFQPGDLFKFQHDRLDWGIGGRLVAASVSQVTLDKSVTIVASTDYVVTTRLDNGSIETKAVDEATTTGGAYPWTGTVIKMAENFTSAPTITEILKPPYAFGEVGLEAVTYRAIKIGREPNFEVSVQAIEFNASIFAETGIAVPNRTPTRTPDYYLPPPDVTNLSLAESRSEYGIIINFNIPSPRLNWDRAEIQYSSDGGYSYQTYLVTRSNVNIVVKNLVPGIDYHIRVISYSSRDVQSRIPPTASIFLSGIAFKPSPVYNLQIKGETHSNYFYGRDCEFVWSWDAGVSPLSYFRVRIEKVDGTLCREDPATDKFYNYSFVKNTQDNKQPLTTFAIVVYVVDQMGHESSSKKLTAINALPGIITGLTAAPSYRAVFFKWEVSLEPDHKDYAIRTKVGTGAWSGWSYIDQNTYTRIMTQAEITTYGRDANNYIEVKDRDLFYQVSPTSATANADAEDLAVDLSGFAFQIVPTDSDSNTYDTLKVLFDSVISSGGVAYTISGTGKYIQFEFPVAFTMNKVMVWPSTTFNCYVAYSADNVTWNYLRGQADHTLNSGKLVEASSQGDAQTNYWTTGTGSPVTAIFPFMRSAKWWRLYVQSSVTIYELKFWAYIIADEIDAGILHLARGITIASTEDTQNAVKLDLDGLKLYGANVNTVWLKNDGTFFFGNSSGANSLTFSGGVLTLNGALVITGASGYINISDKPTSLSGINSGEGSKLGGIESGATVGATWGTNLGSIPATLGTPSGSGLFLSDTYMGYYTASAWKTYIANDGKFAFSGDANNYVSWNGSVLTVRGALVADDITAGTLSVDRISVGTATGNTSASSGASEVTAGAATTICSTILTTIGGFVSINLSTIVANISGDSHIYELQIYKDTTLVYTSDELQILNGEYLGPFGIVYFDTPTAASHTYVYKLYNKTGAGSIWAGASRMVMVEYRK